MWSSIELADASRCADDGVRRAEQVGLVRAPAALRPPVLCIMYIFCAATCRLWEGLRHIRRGRFPSGFQIFVFCATRGTSCVSRSPGSSFQSQYSKQSPGGAAISESGAEVVLCVEIALLLLVMYGLQALERIRSKKGRGCRESRLRRARRLLCVLPARICASRGRDLVGSSC